MRTWKIDRYESLSREVGDGNLAAERTADILRASTNGFDPDAGSDGYTKSFEGGADLRGRGIVNNIES
jgi:hypothetical protein